MIYNGVDLGEYTPDSPHERPEGRLRILVVEGHIHRVQTLALENAVVLARALNREGLPPADLWVAADVDPALQAEMDARAPGLVTWLGVVERGRIPYLDRSAHLLYSAELNPPCPNAVIEALACGLPVVGFAAGSLPELLDTQSGRMSPWGGNIWKLQPPNRQGLAEAALEVLHDQPPFRAGARARAETLFGLEPMVEKYLDVLIG